MKTTVTIGHPTNAKSAKVCQIFSGSAAIVHLSTAKAPTPSTSLKNSRIFQNSFNGIQGPNEMLKKINHC